MKKILSRFAGSSFWRSFGMHPARSLAVFTGVSSVIWVVQTALCQRILPLDVIEAVVWGEQMQWGQMKSPPLSGWIAYGFSLLSGYSDWSLYLAAQLTVVCGIFFTYKLAREFFEETEAATAALLLFFLHYYMPPAMKFCSHDTQVALFPAIGYFFWRGLKENRIGDWLCLAVSAALATLGKYAALQLLCGCFGFMLFDRGSRRRFAAPGPYLAGVLYFVLLLPHVFWLFRHDFLPFCHMEDRLVEGRCEWYEPLTAIGAMLLPYVLFAVLLCVVHQPWKNRHPAAEWKQKFLANFRDPLRRRAAWFSLFLTIVPGLFYLLPALAGYPIVMMWFSYLASFAGITVVAYFPWKTTHEVFRLLLALLWIYFAVLLVAVTVDVLANPRFRIHSDPAEFTELAQQFFRKHSDRPIPVVYGDRWPAGVIQNYLPHRPPACVMNDVCDMALYREKMRREGALLIYAVRGPTTASLEKEGFPAVPLTPVLFSYRSQFGKVRKKVISFGYLPPLAEKKEK